MRSSVKAANDNLNDALIGRTCEVWQPRLGREVSRDEAKHIAGSVVGFFAVFHGHAHGTELPVGASGLLYSIGFVVATGSLHGAGIAIGLIHKWTWGRRALRVAGGIVGLAGVYFLWSAVS